MPAPTLSNFPPAPTPDLPREQFDLAAAAYVQHESGTFVPEMNSVIGWFNAGNYVAQPAGFLASEIATTTIQTTAKAVQTSGYSTAGKGAGLYVNDSLATATLASSHPRFCKLSADGRYWRLDTTGGINPFQAGAIGDDATDDGAAFLAMLDYANAFAVVSGYGKNSPKIHIPAAAFYLGTSTLNILYTTIIEGTGGAMATSGSKLRWAAGTTGIRTHRANTALAATGTTTSRTYGSSGSIIRGLVLYGAYSGTEAEAHGIQLREYAVVENCLIQNFQGDGVFADCSVGGGSNDGQSSMSIFRGVFIYGCRSGWSIDGLDSNGLRWEHCYPQANRRYGWWLKMGIDMTIDGGLCATNGEDTARPTKVNHNGVRYYVLPNQDTGASANSPKGATVTITIASPGVVTWTAHGLTAGTQVVLLTSGALPTGLTANTAYYVTNVTTNTFELSATFGGASINTSGSQSGTHTAGAIASNTWWGHIGAGGYHVNYPNWTSGMTLRSGGAARFDGAGQSGILTGTYFEADQAPFQTEAEWMFLASPVNGAFDARQFNGAKAGGWLHPTSGRVTAQGILACKGNFHAEGGYVDIAPSGLFADTILNMNTNNSYNYIDMRRNGTLEASIASAAQQLYLNGVNGGLLRNNGTTIATWDSTGLHVTGLVESTTSGFKFPDGTTQTTASGAGWNAAGMVREVYGDAASATDQKLGWSDTTAGTTGTPATATTNRITRMNRMERLSTSANAEYGWRWDSGAATFNRDAGFTYEAVFGFSVGATMSEKRLLVGMRSVDAFPGASVDPSSLLNIIGFGADTGDANWQIMRNDGSGTATKVDTGWAKTLGEMFYLRITGAAANYKIYVEKYAAANLTMTPTATFAEATYTTDIAASSTETAPILWGANGATAENGTLARVYARMKSPF